MAVLDVANVSYALPTHSTDKRNVQVLSLKHMTNDMQGEHVNDMELVGATIVPSDPKENCQEKITFI